MTVQKKWMTGLALAPLSLAVALAANPATAADKLLLKTPTAFPTKLPAVGTPVTKLAETLESTSGGSIKMKVYEPGKLIAPSEILDAVSTGKVNSGFAASANWQGKMPAAAFFTSVPFGPEASEFLAWMYYGNGRKLHQEMYDSAGYNVKAIPCGMIPPETSGWFAKPIDKVEDLKGLNMRFYGLGANVMDKMGVGTVQIPPAEIFSALEKGAIDAAEFSLPQVDQMLGFHKIVKYNYFPGWHQQTSMQELLINKDSWHKMNPQQQALLETACKAVVADTLAEGEAKQFEVLATAPERGIELRRWSDEILTAYEQAWDEVVTEKSAEDPFFNKVWQDLSTFRKGYDLWEQNAFLPRKTAQN
ncbi:TRAP-type mannitol/chloroaromatic compound transport system, substrate-binding protein [Oceanospirillum multiglobuliferum]|uniref:C4-dicarboxylate ABC transporter n=1 Tax=Oceanospirillum multiglobuliferum TaxID=64969 RepID=A0A1T4PMK5_9GAMM|nr:TRAP transporter substrate-binding protein [Oceanospirillum multiglobuliferum]OPX55401.1 C4-dicarboxylate ABC transporter [Oceanospirillum multiglobuliferum]SJZ92814.1 TRAP-type mannitol/chloroaromatic compound transport system, substrate-binding protein [Oceanospirillum multiglobuliferum]